MSAREARLRKDYVTYRARLLDLYDRSQSSLLVYELAMAETLLGHQDAALARMREYAALGLAEGKEGTPLLDGVRADPRFAPTRERMAKNLQPVANATPAFELPHDELVTEDIAYDPATKSFFVSSVRHRKIVAVDERGNAHDWVANDDALGSACGLALTSGRLWVGSAELAPMVGYEPKKAHPTALLAYDLATGKRVERIALAAEGEHALTDLAADAKGDVFASDALGGGVYMVRVGAHTLEPLSADGTFLSPQAPAVLDEGRTLLVPDYIRGIARLDVATHAVTWLAHPGVAVNGIDGLYASGGALYAIQNGTLPVRLVRFELDAAGKTILKATPLEQQTPGLGEPTHGVFAGSSFFFLANAG
ncbi:MAG TPA: hypothetical protein VGI39_39895, partial [Polyangiaceae bacterium]